MPPPRTPDEVKSLLGAAFRAWQTQFPPHGIHNAYRGCEVCGVLWALGLLYKLLLDNGTLQPVDKTVIDPKGNLDFVYKQAQEEAVDRFYGIYFLKNVLFDNDRFVGDEYLKGVVLYHDDNETVEDLLRQVLDEMRAGGFEY